jgi:hypothetical protein
VDESEPVATAMEYSALVRGPSASFPRGGVWLFGVWYAGMYLCLLAVAGFSLWENLVVLALFAAAAGGTIIWFNRGTSRAFAADDSGIWLGKQTAMSVRQRLSWEQIRQLTISAQPHGSMLQVLLVSGVPVTGRFRQAASLALMVLPLGIRRTKPELLTVLPDPPRYQVPLARVTPSELKSALSALAPSAVLIETLA